MDLFSVLAKLAENSVHPSIVAQVSQLRAKLTKDDSMVTENGQECDHYQHEPEQDHNGDELSGVKGKGKGQGGGFLGTCFNCGVKCHNADMCPPFQKKEWTQRNEERQERATVALATPTHAWSGNTWNLFNNG